MNRFRSRHNLAPLRQAEAYWNALREGSEVPRRSQVDPRGLENILPHTFILERIAPGIARFRLAGQHLTELAGTDLRGMPISALFSSEGRSEISAVLESLFDGPTIAELSLDGAGNALTPGVDARMVLLPLAGERGEISRALGVMAADRIPRRPLPRFRVDEVTLRPVFSPAAPQRPLYRSSDQPAVAPASLSLSEGMAEEPAPFDTAPKQGRPNLRLVASND
ncbi:PAS domain-containing protein [Primorskyibacter sp. S87]|uniref:PAS domain-containing protein n=1 Tax=Primorskyibacter sp. S87 TaxID=3415126 RepID=UPI003C79DD59